MYAHPQQSLSNQKVRYSTQPPQSYPNYPQPGMSNSQYNTQNFHHHSPTHSQAQHYQMNSQQMNYNPNPVWNGPPNANYVHQQQQYINSNVALIQPPALNVQQNIDTSSQFFPARQPMALSNNQHSEFDNIQQQQQEQMWTNQAQIASMFWQQRCMTMLQRFQWFYQRFQILRGEYINLSDQMQKMDSEEEWHNFQQHHDQFHEKIVEMQQELSAVLGQNQQLLQQKQVQEGESVWEQRYQQLLGNFKSLQEEMSHMQAGGGQANAVSPEQYQHLEDQFGQLQYQYGEVVNELQNYRGAEMHINQYLQQIQNYKHKLDSLQNENIQMQQMILQLQQKNKQLEQGYQNVVERQKYEELAYMIEQKDRQIEQLQDYKNKSGNQSSISQYETTLANKNAEIDILRQKLAEKDKEISVGIAKLQSTEATLTNNLRSEFDNQRYEMQRKISELQKDLKEMKKETARSSTQNSKVQTLQKKIEGLNNQVTSLNETLKKKNQELNELRPMSYELERLKENESNYTKVLEEKNKISQMLKKKNAEIEAMHHQVQKLSAKVHEVSNKKQEYSTRNLMIEIEDLSDQLRRYEGEISKLKSIIELKEQYSQKLQGQIRLINEKYISTEQTLLSERQNWREAEIKLSSKNLEHEKRIKNLDYEFNLQLKDNLEKEVIALRKQNVEKQETIRSMEEKELLLASQIAVFEKLKNNFDRDVSLLRKKQKQLQTLNEAQARRFKQLEAAYFGKENDVDELKINQISMSSQLSALQTQIDDSNSLIKTKNKTIQNLQAELRQQLGRTQLVDQLINQNGKLKIALKSSQQQLERLKFNNESRLDHSKVLSRAQSRKDLEKEEINLINQLQEQNTYLKAEISKLMEKQISLKSIPQQSQPISPQSKLVSLDLNKRLNQFNFKLHHTINDPKSSLSHSKSQKVIELWQNERKQLVDRYEAEIARLRQQVNERQSNRINVTQKTQQTHVSESPRKQAYSLLQSQQLREQILFFRQKYKEQEERNQTLVKINEELKSKVDNALKIKQGVSTTDYYKEQIKLMENQNQLLKNKCKKMLDQNKEIKVELSNKNSKLSKDYELKILQLELHIQELKRKVSYLNAEKASAHNQRASVQYNNYNTFNHQKDAYQAKTYKQQKYYEYAPQSPKNIEQQFQSVLGNLQGNASPKNNQQSYGPISQISSHTYNDSRVNPTRSRNQK